MHFCRHCLSFSVSMSYQLAAMSLRNREALHSFFKHSRLFWTGFIQRQRWRVTSSVDDIIQGLQVLQVYMLQVLHVCSIVDIPVVPVNLKNVNLWTCKTYKPRVLMSADEITRHRSRRIKRPQNIQLNTTNVKPVEIYLQLREVCGQSSMDVKHLPGWRFCFDF